MFLCVHIPMPCQSKTHPHAGLNQTDAPLVPTSMYCNTQNEPQCVCTCIARHKHLDRFKHDSNWCVCFRMYIREALQQDQRHTLDGHRPEGASQSVPGRCKRRRVWQYTKHTVSMSFFFCMEVFHLFDKNLRSF